MNICLKIKDIISENLPQILSLRAQKKQKEDGSFVSEGDLLCEGLVKSFLNEFDSSIYLVSEEKDNTDFTFEEYPVVVILDPIDGTENFVSGLKEWGIGISVYSEGKHVESMIGLPELDQYIISGDKVPKFESRLYGISSSLTREDILQLEEGYEYRIIGCCMYNMYNVITGAFAYYKNPNGANTWDILPGLNLALENNCIVKVENQPYHGEFLFPSRKYRFEVKSQ